MTRIATESAAAAVVRDAGAVSPRHDPLIEGRCRILPFRELPIEFRQGVVQYLAYGGEAWDLHEERLGPDHKATMLLNMAAYETEHGDEPIGLAMVPAEELKASVMADAWLDPHPSFDDYHRDYLARADGRCPPYPPERRWPCFLSQMAEETFEDGWHRFHAYVRDGATEIPVAFFPASRHLAAAGRKDAGPKDAGTRDAPEGRGRGR